jgi:hypothetical protein
MRVNCLVYGAFNVCILNEISVSRKVGFLQHNHLNLATVDQNLIDTPSLITIS